MSLTSHRDIITASDIKQTIAGHSGIISDVSAILHLLILKRSEMHH